MAVGRQHIQFLWAQRLGARIDDKSYVIYQWMFDLTTVEAVATAEFDGFRSVAPAGPTVR